MSDPERIDPPADDAGELGLMTRKMRASGVEVTVSADPDDLYFQSQLAADDNFEPAVSVGMACLEPAAVVFDLGACLGTVSAAFATMVPSGRVVAVEPNQSAQAGLRATLIDGELRNVTIVAAAIGSDVGLSSYHQDPSGGAWGYTSATGGREVAQTTVDELVAVHGFDRVDLIKIDIEGHELAALSGAERTIQRHQPVLVVELNPFCLWRFGRTLPQDLVAWIADRYPHVWAIRPDASVEHLDDAAAIDRMLVEVGVHGGLVDLVASPRLLELSSPLWVAGPVEAVVPQDSGEARPQGSWFRRRR